MEKLLNIQGIEAFGFFGYDTDSLSGNEELILIDDNQMLGYLHASRKCVIGPERGNFDYAMKYWNTPARSQALQNLKRAELMQGKPRFFTALAEIYDETSDLGKIRIPKKLKEAVKVATGVKVLEKAAQTKIGKKAIEIGKKTLVVLNKVNPATLLIRNALRGLIALNFLGLATILSSEKGKSTREKVENMYKNMGGEVSKLNQAIENGKGKKPLFNKDAKKYADDTSTPKAEDVNGFLGEPATAGLLVSAGAFILKIWNWIKGQGITLQKVGEVAKNVIDKAKNIIGKKENDTPSSDVPAEVSQTDTNPQPDNTPEINSPITDALALAEAAKRKRRRNIVIASVTGVVVIGGITYAINRNKKKTAETNRAQLETVKFN